MSEDQLPPQDPALRNSPIVSEETAASAAKMPDATSDDARICYWNGEKYSDGASLCSDRRRHKCWSGRWVDIGNC